MYWSLTVQWRMRMTTSVCSWGQLVKFFYCSLLWKHCQEVCVWHFIDCVKSSNLESVGRADSISLGGVGRARQY